MPVVMLAVFALTLFLSASLLFLIEPMVGKMMLPLLGGTPAVWNTCMVFFQAILLAGYAYSHWTTQALGPRRQARLQLAVLLLPFLSFIVNAALFSGPLSPAESMVLGHEGNPIPVLLLVLTLSIGLPMFVVCTSAPLLQRWFSSTNHPSARDPYFLYGASNLGSMLTLIAYPTIIEPNLDLDAQKDVVMIGCGLLAVLVAVCAYLMWTSEPARPVLAGAPGEAPTGSASPTAFKAGQRDKVRAGRSEAWTEEAPAGPSDHPVDWLRRLRWIALAAVPSSLMLGVTTYMTTDIAAIPLLWILPLSLYLLTFIVVFQTMTPRTQAIGLIVVAGLLLGAIVWKVAPMFFKEDADSGSPAILWLIRLACVGLFVSSFWLLKANDKDLIHHVMIMIMPLLVLLILFMMLSEVKPPTVLNICIHLLSLLVVSMVCHGEMARDRPGPSQLTEFFLLMSIGGVIGGLFNALVAPMVFNSHLEYPLMLMVACLLLPPLGLTRDSPWARRADLALGSIFLVLGVALIVIFANDKNVQPGREALKAVPWAWVAVAVVGGLTLAAWAASKNFGVAPAEAAVADDRTDRVLDIVLPLCLVILTIGLLWGLPTAAIKGRLGWLASKVRLSPENLITVLSYGLPAVLCYTFVERGLRFGLGVGGLLLACGVSGIIKDPPLYQDRSFFGVLKVEDRSYDIPTGRTFAAQDYDADRMYRYRRLLHGTTLHGEQFLDDGARDVPLSYYHRTGPAGRIFRAYNDDPKRPFAVIGLGTGTMSCYGLKTQKVDFFDIDPVVVEISYDTNRYFTFVEDALARGVDVSLVLGDARLTFARRPGTERPRLKPLQGRPGEKKPERQFGPPLTEDERYRLIVVDAFSSDAIPVHLITREALEIYLERLADDGILCIHISNRYLDLHPVLANIVQKIRQEGSTRGEAMPELCGYHMSDDDDAAPGKNRSHWVAITRRKSNLAKVLKVPDASDRWERDPTQLRLVGAMCWPAASPGLQLVQGLAGVCREMVDRERAREESTGGQPVYRVEWQPVEDAEELERKLNEIRLWQESLLPGKAWSASLSSPDLAAELAPLSSKLEDEWREKKAEDRLLDEKLERVEGLWRGLANPGEEADTVVTFARREMEELERDLPGEKDAEKRSALLNRLKRLDLFIGSAKQKLQVALVRETLRRTNNELDDVRRQVGAETKDEKKQAELRLKQRSLEAAREGATRRLAELQKESASKARDALEAAEKAKDATRISKAADDLTRQVRDGIAALDQDLDRLRGPRQEADSEYAYVFAESYRLSRKLSRLRRQYNDVDDLPGKVKRIKRVGVWTDGYSNILSVFNW